MSIPQAPTGTANPAPYATLRAAARDSQVTRAALAILIELSSDTNEWKRFSVTALASAFPLSRETVSRALRTLARRGYLEERITRGKVGEREARLASGAPGMTR